MKGWSSSRKGDIAELYVTYEGLRRGAEVFPNASRVGDADLIMLIYGKLYQFNVKMAGIEYNGDVPYWKARNVHKVKPPVWPISVEPRVDGWKIRWPWATRGRPSVSGGSRFYCPPGLEDFWKSPIKSKLIGRILSNETTN